MTAYNRLGNQWCGGSKALVTDLLRTEWGFDGYVITDASIDLTGNGYLDPALAVYARNSGILTMIYVVSASQTKDALKSAYEADPIGMGNAMRLCAYDICKMKMQSNAFVLANDEQNNPSTNNPDQNQGNNNDPQNNGGNANQEGIPDGDGINFFTLSNIVKILLSVFALAIIVIIPLTTRKRRLS